MVKTLSHVNENEILKTMAKMRCFTRYKASKSDLHDFDSSRSLMVKSDGGVRLPIYDFLLMFNGRIGPISPPLRDIILSFKINQAQNDTFSQI